jgi:hypothetical protein
MTLAAILAVYILSFAWLLPGVPIFAGIANGQQPQSQPAQSPQPAQQSAPSGQTQNSTNRAEPTSTPRKHRKKAGVPDCSSSPTPLNTAAGSPSGSTKSANAAAANSGSSNVSSDNSASASASPSSTPSKPCPPPKKVVRNGGTDEPTIQLTGGTTAAQASQERATTEQLTASTEENLKKIADRQLNPSQQEIVNQIQQFVDQSKKAVAAGDLERAHNLALKARLLSDELLKP